MSDPNSGRMWQVAERLEPTIRATAQNAWLAALNGLLIPTVAGMAFFIGDGALDTLDSVAENQASQYVLIQRSNAENLQTITGVRSDVKELINSLNTNVAVLQERMAANERRIMGNESKIGAVEQKADIVALEQARIRGREERAPQSR